MPRVLVVEDDTALRETLRYNFERAGYAVSSAATGPQALALARQEHPDAVVLDVMLPELDGFDVCRELRRESTVPILMLTARDDEVDKIVGLELGADDYMTKPFSVRELLTRVKGMLRRVQMLQVVQGRPAAQSYELDDIRINLDERRVFKGGAPVHLKLKEFDLLVFLVQNPGRVFTRDQLLSNVWGYDFVGDSRTVDVHVRWLRQKLEADPSNPRLIETVRGVGYRCRS
ncbi:MAG: response regulator transcription factor [Chloroflexota bacterium]